MRKSVQIYFCRENEISLRHVTFFRHAALAENLDANAAKPPAVQGLKGNIDYFRAATQQLLSQLYIVYKILACNAESEQDENRTWDSPA
jgi:hypothetical protein